MCARFELINPLRFRDPIRFPIGDTLLWTVDRPDIRPTQIVPVIVAGFTGRELVGMRWGLVPYWANDISEGDQGDQRPCGRHRGQALFPRPLAPLALPDSSHRLH